MTVVESKCEQCDPVDQAMISFGKCLKDPAADKPAETCDAVNSSVARLSSERRPGTRSVRLGIRSLSHLAKAARPAADAPKQQRRNPDLSGSSEATPARQRRWSP